MANKKERDKWIQQHNQNEFTVRSKKLGIFNLVALGCFVVALLLCFIKWAYVYNTAYGTEVKVSGWSFFIAGITQNFESTSGVYGDLAVPFYYYAKSYCEILSIVALITIVICIVSAVIVLLNYFKNNEKLSLIGAILSIVSFIGLIACFIIALSMKDSEILPVYCSGNTACSIRSLAIIPAIFVAGAVASLIFKQVKLNELKGLYNIK